MAFADKADLKTGFFLGLGLVFAYIVLNFVSGLILRAYSTARENR